MPEYPLDGGSEALLSSNGDFGEYQYAVTSVMDVLHTNIGMIKSSKLMREQTQTFIGEVVRVAIEHCYTALEKIPGNSELEGMRNYLENINGEMWADPTYLVSDSLEGRAIKTLGLPSAPIPANYE